MVHMNKKDLKQAPPNVTPCPFASSSEKRKAEEDSESKNLAKKSKPDVDNEAPSRELDVSHGDQHVKPSSLTNSEEADAELSPEALAKKKAAAEWLRKPPRAGVVRYLFDQREGLLGLRLSRDVPPWILDVKEGSLAWRKDPQVPLGGLVIAINGQELTEACCAEATEALPRRPLTLDIEWPIDQILPDVRQA